MRLSVEQKKFLREGRDIIADEICDTCGAVLGCIRFTRKGEPGDSVLIARGSRLS
jgi:hypothetical protein